MIFNGPRPPIVVVSWMLQPIEEIGCQSFPRARFDNRITGERQFPRPEKSVCVFLHAALKRILCQPRRPGFAEPLFEGAALVRPSIVVIGSGHDRKNSGQVRRLCHSGKHLGRADVGSAKHSYLAIGIRQGRSPFHRVISVSRFMFEGVPLAFGRKTSSDILNHGHIATRCSL